MKGEGSRGGGEVKGGGSRGGGGDVKVADEEVRC